MITKKEISETLSLSCVENYFLAWLNRYYDVTKLYGNSFISLKQAFDDFANGAMYQNYCYLPRLQDIAEEYGVVEHLYLPCSAKEALKILGNQNEDDLFLIRVNTAFFIGYKRSSWREDHYICVNNKLEWINEYPLSEGKFTEERFTEVYDGAVCIYKVKDTKTDLPDYASMQFKMQDFDLKELPNNLSALESAIGVLRVSRKRLARYYFKNENVNSLLNEEIGCMDKIYFDVHLRRLKEFKKEEVNKIKAYSELYQKIVYILEIEKKVAEVLNDGQRRY